MQILSMCNYTLIPEFRKVYWIVHWRYILYLYQWSSFVPTLFKILSCLPVHIYTYLIYFWYIRLTCLLSDQITNILLEKSWNIRPLVIRTCSHGCSYKSCIKSRQDLLNVKQVVKVMRCLVLNQTVRYLDGFADGKNMHHTWVWYFKPM